MIHAAIAGSLERCAKNTHRTLCWSIPSLWLSPVQVKVIPVRTNHNEYAKGF